MKPSAVPVLILLPIAFTLPLPSQQPWRRCDIPGSPSVRSLALDSTGTIFAGSDVGLFRSTDLGATWIQVGGEQLWGRVSAMAVTSTGLVYAGIAGRLYRSSDGGEMWDSVLNQAGDSDLFGFGINDCASSNARST